MKYIWLILSQSQYFFFSFFWFILNVNYILMQSWYYFCWLIIFLPFVNLLINQFTSTLAHHLAKNVWIFFLLHFFSSRRKLIFFFLNKKIFYTFLFFCLLYTHTHTTVIVHSNGERTNRLGQNLNRSQYDGCSTKYNTLTTV